MGISAEQRSIVVDNTFNDAEEEPADKKTMVGMDSA